MATPRYDYDGRTVIVTGGTSGIGREVCRRFGEAGATVINADVTDEPKDADVPTRELLREAGATAEYVETDVSEPDDIRVAIEAAREHGGVDVMVNNAAIQIPRRLREMTKAEFDRIHAVNVGGAFFGTKLAAEEMIDRGVEGAIVNTASISSNEAQFGQVGYDSTKGAVRMITRGSALELAEEGIRVNAVAPGQIATEFTEGWSDRAREKAAAGDLLKPVPLGRAGTPADVAGAYLFLASDDAGYVTGELLQVDGGWQVC